MVFESSTTAVRLETKTGEHPIEGARGFKERSAPGGRYSNVFARSPALHRSRFADPERDEALLRQALERDIHGAERRRAFGARFDLRLDGCAVSIITQVLECRQNVYLELAERGASWFLFPTKLDIYTSALHRRQCRRCESAYNDFKYSIKSSLCCAVSDRPFSAT
jgi:hypothetical protein